MNLINRIRYKLNKNNKPFKLKKIDPIKKSKAMDLVLELCMEYYTGKEQKIDFYKVEAKLFDNLGLHSWESEFLLNIMSNKGYIKEEYNENEVLDKIFAKPEGIKIFIDGGFEIEARRKKNERILIRIAQWSSAIVGLYYLLSLLEEFFALSIPTFKEIYYWLIGLF